MKPTIMFLAITTFQACLSCCSIGLLAMWLREDGPNLVIKIGWPFVFFTAFDVGNPTLNHGVNTDNFMLDLAVSFLIALPMVVLLRRFLSFR